MKKYIMLVITVVLIITMSLPLGISAITLDVGNTNDYGGGWGGSDWGSDWDSGWGSSYGNSYYYDSDFEFDGIFPIILVVAIIAAVILIKLGPKSKRSKTGNSTNLIRTNIPTVRDNSELIETTLRQTDPHFSAEKFIAWSKEVFMTLQTAWTERDWSKIRPFEKEELFKVHEQQLEEYKRLGRINLIERVNIRDAYLTRYVRDKDYEYLTVFLKARMGDCIIDENTKEVIKGDSNAEYEMGYIIGFIRKNGIKTDVNLSNHSTTNCPNCGAPTTVTSAGQCEYCDSIITSGEFDWVMYQYEGASSTNINEEPIRINDQ